MAEFVVSFVVETLGTLLIDEVRFLRGIEGKVQDLCRELKLIRCFLRDADARREHNQFVGECVAQLRDFAYDAEDIIERYILRVALKKGTNIIKAYACFMAKSTCLQVHVVGTEIEGLKSSISNLRRIMESQGLQSVNEGERKWARASTPKRTYAHFEEEIVGREGSIKTVVEELKDGKQHRVVSIWGMGGLGKTTLAKKVFNHDELKNHFDGFAWACISQEYRVRKILEEIFVKLIPDQREEVKDKRDEELFEAVYKIQQQKRCIVVLDDIWTKGAWDNLRDAFPINNTRSKLLITTRNKEVAEYIDLQGHLHELQCLSKQESWDLLKNRAFPTTKGIVAGQAIGGSERRLELEGQLSEITENMERLGDEILKKCGGLPLAIIVLGGLLAVNEWETVHKKINLHLSDKSDISKVLAFSYDDLPWHLKPCFLYLGSFPEDVEIPATKVLHMWIAEGFVSLSAYEEAKEIQVEDVAKQYLMELVNRGMVQVRFSWSGKIKTCHLHDLMRDLCVSKATQEGFLSTLNIKQDGETEDGSSSMAIKVEPSRKVRRLSVNMCTSAEGNTLLNVKPIGRTMLQLRTLMFFGSVEEKWKQFQPIFNHCKFLRVLKLEGLCKMRGNLPNSVGDLVHLRFLSLARSEFKGLPQSMGNLVRLEYLNLDLSSEKTIVPNVLWKMRRLRHLYLPKRFYISFFEVRKKLRLDTLKNLRNLKNFCLTDCDVKDIDKLTNLRELTVISYASEIFPQLVKFNSIDIQFLSFRFKSDSSFTEGELGNMSICHHSCKLFLNGKIDKLPEHTSLPQQLRKLVLMQSKLEEDPMPILEKLNHLVVLIIGVGTFEGKEMVCSAGGFPQLKHLFLCGLYHLEELRVAEGGMPHLSRFGISQCPKLKTSPPQGVPTYDYYEEVKKVYGKAGWDSPSLPERHGVRREMGLSYLW